MPSSPRPPGLSERSVSDLDTLRSIPLLASLNDEQLARERQLFRKRAVAKGAYLFFEGDPPERFYILLKGQVKLLRSSEGKDLILRIVGPGEWLGGVAAFGRRPHPYSAQAMVPSVIMEIGGPDFAGLMERYPTVAQQVIEGLVDQLTEAHEMMRRLALEPVEPRLAYTLLQLAAKSGTGGANHMAITIPLTRQTLAELAGTTVETAIRVISKWRRLGLVREEGGQIVLADAPALRMIAGKDRPAPK